MSTAFDVAWSDDDRRLTLNGWEFVTVHGGGAYDAWKPGENCFLLFKTRALVDQYLEFFGELRSTTPIENVLELGLYDGGSIPFWVELLEPTRHVGVDIREPNEAPWFRHYAEQRKQTTQIETRWKTSQADRKQTLAIQDEVFGGAPIDLLIDDASHFYEETRASFENLFPRVRPGGYYIIEDWAWFHWRGIEDEWARKAPLSRLILELVEAAGSSSTALIRSLRVCSGFAVVQRGHLPQEELDGFRLDDFIYRHPR